MVLRSECAAGEITKFLDGGNWSWALDSDSTYYRLWVGDKNNRGEYV